MARLHTVLRIFLIVFAAGCLLTTLAFWVATRSWFILAQLQPELEKRLGGDVQIGEAAYQGDGRVIFKDMRLRVNGLTGPAADIAHIGQAVVTVQLESLWPFSLRISDIDVDHAVLRISEDVRDDGRLNLWALKPRWGTSVRTTPFVPPRIHLRRAVIEFGKHRDAIYSVADSRVFTGEMQPIPNESQRYDFLLTETAESGPSPDQAIIIRGDLNAGTNRWRTRIDSLYLDDRIRRMCPAMVQALWSKMDLQGSVRQVEAEWSPDQTFSINLVIDGVELTLPVESNLEWARYRSGQVETTSMRPRQRFRHGSIEVTNTSLRLSKLRGEVGGTDVVEGTVGVPYELSLTVADFPSLDWENPDRWIDHVLKTAPFELKFKIDEFNLRQPEGGVAPAVDLPYIVANILQKFYVSDCLLSTSVDVVRIATDSGPKTTANGVTFLQGATGRYQKFPYRLENVDAYLQFDNEKVVVHYLTGTGSGGGSVRITGEITPPSNDAKVALRLVGSNVPVDDRLREALDGNELEAFDMFFNPALLKDLPANSVPDDAAITARMEQVAALQGQIDALRKNTDPNDSIQRAILAEQERLLIRKQRAANASAFQLGGVINLNLNIDRAFGEKQRTYTTGIIDVQSVGTLYEKFPYPLRFTGGRLNWQRDRINIETGADGKGLPFLTPAGGSGVVTGELLLPERDGSPAANKKIRPALTFHITDDEISESVLVAIEQGSEAKQAATLLRNIDLHGPFHVQGDVTADDAGRINYDFAITLDQCIAQLNPDLASTIGARGELWPPHTTLRRVTGQVHVSRDRVELTGVNGAIVGAEDASISINGAVDLRSQHRQQEFSVGLRNFPIQPYILNAVTGSMAPRAQQLWAKYAPQGDFDAKVHVRSADQTPTSVSLEIEPRQFSINLDGSRFITQRTGGQVAYANRTIGFDELRLRMSNTDAIDEGSLVLHGKYELNDDANSFDLQGEFVQARMESPWVRYILNALASEQVSIGYDQMRPVGLFDATFVATSSEIANSENALDWRIALQPQSVGLTWRGKPVLATFDQGTVEVQPGEVRLKAVQGKHAEGEFMLNGLITTAHPIDATLQLTYLGQIRSDFLEAFLPDAVIAAIDAIKFSDTGPTVLDQCTLQMSEERDDQGETKWSTHFSGPIRFAAASFEAGLQFDQVAGTALINLQHKPGMPLALEIKVDAEHAHAMGQRLSNIEADFHLTDEGEVLRMPSFRAEAEGGVVVADAWTGIGDRSDYASNVDMVAVPLSRFRLADSSTGDGSAEREQPAVSGDLFASMSIAGQRGDPQSRSGRGVLRVLNGRMANLPLVMQVLQLVQFSSPLVSNLDYADVEMYLSGDQLMFQTLMLESTTGSISLLQLRGEGSMNFDTLELDTRFKTRGAVPIVRDVVGGVGDKLYSIEVTGPLRSPRARVIALPQESPSSNR